MYFLYKKKKTTKLKFIDKIFKKNPFFCPNENTPYKTSSPQVQKKNS